MRHRSDEVKSLLKSILVTAFLYRLLPFSLVDKAFRRFKWLRGA